MRFYLLLSGLCRTMDCYDMSCMIRFKDYLVDEGDAAQTKCRKYYKSGSTLDIRHFEHALGWEMARNSQCCPFSNPK